MNNKIRRLMCGIIVLGIIMSGITSFAATTKSISVSVNAVSIKVNGKITKIDNFTYNGKIYVQPQDIASLLNISYAFNASSKTITLDDVKPAKAVALVKANFAAVKAATAKKLTVTSNLVVVKVKGIQTKTENLSYNYSIYIYMKEVSDLLGKDYLSDSKNKIESITDKKPTTPVLSNSATGKVKDKVTINISNWGNAVKKEYSLDNANWKSYTAPVDMTATGTIYAKGTNAGGIASNVGSLVVNNVLVKQTIKDIAKQSDRLVLLKIYDVNDIEIGSGSGFIVSADGKVVTNYHVVDMAPRIDAVTSDNKVYTVSGILDYSIEKDLAVIKLDKASNLPIVDLDDSDKIELGEDVVAIGSPLGLQNTVSNGIVSSIREGLNRTGYTDIQISVPISSGSSGGALFNMYGQVVGVTYAGYSDGQNLNLAIPINDVKSMLSSKNLKKLADVIKEAYPTMTYSEYSYYMYANHPNYKAEVYNFSFSSIDVEEYSEDPKQLSVFLYMNSRNYSNVLLAQKDGNEKEIEKWLAGINSDAGARYTDKEVTTYIFYYEGYDTKPSGYSDSDLTYDSGLGKWYVCKAIAFYSPSAGLSWF